MDSIRRELRTERVKTPGLLVPRDGVEPPTPAFSGPGRFEVICLIALILSVF